MSNRKNCEGTTRRDCLKLGLGTVLGGGSLINLLRLKSHAGESAVPDAQAKSCILVWLDGGPTHYETFDPKPEAPKEIRGEFSPISTAIPGVQFSQYMEKTAAMLDEFAVVRSIRHNQGNHGAGNHYMMTGAPP
ncbi:MAG: DUF1501 domain-containing protein, partial [Planctomycetaceae bacterium]|nr:DUF1501 domain-containing protein [Planctomycetaceae bacterium]